MKHKQHPTNGQALALACMLRVGSFMPILFLAGCSSSLGANPTQPIATDPASGDLLKTLDALETGKYEQYLQARRAELRNWQSQQTKQQMAIKQLQAQQARLQQEASTLAQTSSTHTQRTQQSQHKIKILNQQRTKLATEIQALQAATRQLEQARQQQAQQEAEQQQRINTLLAERERLRKALKLMINSDH